MNSKNLLKTALFVVIAGTAACHQAESPAKVEADVSKARQESAESVASAEKNAGKDIGKAVDQAVQSAADVALAKANGDHKVATEKCEALAGDSQKTCKDRADADLELAKAQVKENLAGKM